MSIVCRSISAVLVTSGALLTVACGGGTDGSGGSPAKAAARVRSPGEAAYLAVCANCHLEQGRGMAPAYRSLVGSAWAVGAPDRAIAIVLHGIRGPVKDARYTYHTSMLPFGSGVAMGDTVVAAAVTYVRTSWGNTSSPVTAADVARVRARFAGRTVGFTQAELDAMTR